MKKSLIANVTLIFMLVSFIFMSLTDLHFLILLPLIFIGYALEGRVKNKFLIKSVEVMPLLFFTFAVVTSMPLFYLLSYLLAITLIAKFILNKKRRDYYEIFLVSILVVLLSSVATISVSFGILLFLFFFFGALMLIFAQFDGSIPRLSHKFYISLFLFSVLSFLFSFALFFSFPRLSLGYIHGVQLSPEKSSGFSKNIDMESSNVTLDNSIVMRVKVDKRSSHSIYITGMHYIYFDGRRWRTELAVKKVFPDLVNYFGDKGRGAYEETIYLEPTGTDVLFGMDKFVGVHGEFLYLKQNIMGDFFTDSIYYKTIKYDAVSVVQKIPVNINTEGNIPDEIKKYYLALPAMSDEFTNLCKRLTSGKNEYGKVQSIIQYLNSHCDYSLTPDASSIEDFVINGRKGYCKHFATALVLMLRESGVPARLVSGFVTSEWNPTGNYFIVRAKDAHVWTEVYFPGYGWVRFDPTPSVPETVESKLSLFIDSIKMSWYRNVITYDTSNQLDLLSYIGRGATYVSHSMNNVSNFFRFFLKKWKLISLCIALFILFFIAIKREKTPERRAFDRILLLIGSDRKPYETLLEYAKRKEKYNLLEELIYLYYRYRFSRRVADAAMLIKIEKSIADKIS